MQMTVESGSWTVARREGGERAAAVWASTTPFGDDDIDADDFPMRTILQLPSDGVAIVAFAPRPYLGETSFPQLDTPVSLADGTFVSGEQPYERRPAEGMSMYQIDGWTDEGLLGVTVYVNNPHPDARLIRAIDKQLARLDF